MHGPASLGGTGTRRDIPAPVGGWNTRDALATMKKKYGIRLDNFFPEAGAVTLRRGCVEHSKGFGDSNNVNSIFAHDSDVKKLYAVADGKLWDATGSTASSLASGITNEFVDTAAHGGSTIIVNGVNPPMRIQPDGTLAAAHNWAKHTDAGSQAFNANSLFKVLPFKGRLFFIERDSATLWYTDTFGAVQGDLRPFNFNTYHREGGALINFGTLTIDAGNGIDDLLVLFFDNGSAIVYQGTDIASADTWRIVGTWNIGRLVGDKPLVKVGGDLIGITTDGYVSMGQLLTKGRVAERMASLSDTIASTVTERGRLYGDINGWDSVLYTPASWLLFNIPIGGGEQHVMNTQTKAWCRFRGWDAKCFAIHKDRLFFGTRGKICEANAGSSDDGAPIFGDVQTAYNYLGTPNDKRFTMARALVSADANISNLKIATSSDFTEEAVTETLTDIALSGAEWNKASWNTADWAGGTFVLNEWQQLNREGSALSLRVTVNTAGARVSFFAADIRFEPTTGIL